MSTTFHLECDSCKESIWIGQRSHGRSYVYYGHKEIMDLLEVFLYKHQTNRVETHVLAFRPDGSSRYMDGQDEWVRIEQGE